MLNSHNTHLAVLASKQRPCNLNPWPLAKSMFSLHTNELVVNLYSRCSILISNFFSLNIFPFWCFLIPKDLTFIKSDCSLDLTIGLVLAVDENAEVSTNPGEEELKEANRESTEEKLAPYDDHLTPAERRYIEQREQLDIKRLAKEANKSHRDRIQDFNQYLANMSEHYDIPKVGPG